MDEDWSIHEVTTMVGTTSRTLRHYDAVGLLPPTRIASNGYRHYDRGALVRLQRILLLRGSGLGLGDIARVLAGEVDDVAALERHVVLLEGERARVDARIRAVRATVDSLREGTDMRVQDMFDGFDAAEHRDEVAERWGADAERTSHEWWQGLDDVGRRGVVDELRDLAARFAAARREGHASDDTRVGDLVDALRAWVGRAWGGREVPDDAFVGLGELYVADERFAVHFDLDGPGGAAYVRDAIRARVANGTRPDAG